MELNSNPVVSSYIVNILKSTHEMFRDCGNRMEMRCKICNDSKKSKFKRRLNYYPTTNSVFCFNCNYNNNALYYLSQISHKPVSQIKIEIFRECGGTSLIKYKPTATNKPEYDLLKLNDIQEVQDKFSSFSLELPKEAKQWIESRKIFKAPFIQRGFYFRWDEYKKKLVFPWLLNNKVFYYQHRSIFGEEPKYLFPFGFKRPFFGIDVIDKSIPYIILCESAIDSIFIKNCVGAGSILINKQQIEIIKKIFPHHEIIIFPDNPLVDTASGRIIFDLIRKFPTVKFFLFPPKYKQFKDVGAIASINTSMAMDFANIDFLLKNSHSAAKTLAILSMENKYV